MALPVFKRVKSQDRIVNQIQDNVEQVLSPLLRALISDGRLIENILIETGTPKSINHGLGRKLRGWMVTSKNSNADIWDSQSTNKLSSKTLILNSSANVIISLWVF